MKILIVTHYFTPHTGGIELVAYNQAKELIKLGNQVTVLTTRSNGEKEFETIDGIYVIRINASNFLENKMGIPYPLISPTSLKIFSKEISQHDITHVHGHIYLTSLFACYIAKKLKKPIILTQHSTFVFHKNLLLRSLETIADKTIANYTLNSAARIIAVSEKTKEYVNSILHKDIKIYVIYNGVDIERFKPSHNKSELKEELGIKNKFICLCIRRITFKNGINNLLKVAETISDKENILFLLGGKGPDFDNVKDYIQKNNLNNIELIGFIDDTILPKYYAASDVFILPSQLGEGFPLVVLEAFSSGVPVIATKSGGHIEIVKDGLTGYLTDIIDPNQITQKVEYLYNKPEELQKMGNNCRNLIQEQFSWETSTQQLINLYKEIL